MDVVLGQKGRSDIMKLLIPYSVNKTKRLKYYKKKQRVVSLHVQPNIQST